jgi:hypothetical protein
MNQIGSGGIGAVSAGIVESLVWVLAIVVLVLLAVGVWKALAWLWTLFG